MAQGHRPDLPHPAHHVQLAPGVLASPSPDPVSFVHPTFPAPCAADLICPVLPSPPPCPSGPTCPCVELALALSPAPHAGCAARPRATVLAPGPPPVLCPRRPCGAEQLSQRSQRRELGTDSAAAPVTGTLSHQCPQPPRCAGSLPGTHPLAPTQSKIHARDPAQAGPGDPDRPYSLALACPDAPASSRTTDTGWMWSCPHHPVPLWVRLTPPPQHPSPHTQGHTSQSFECPPLPTHPAPGPRQPLPTVHPPLPSHNGLSHSSGQYHSRL